MSDKNLPQDPAQFSTWLRQRAEGHSPGYDIVVYGRPSQWLRLANQIDHLKAAAERALDPTRPRASDVQQGANDSPSFSSVSSAMWDAIVKERNDLRAELEIMKAADYEALRVGVQSAECCRGLAPKWQCRCEIERLQATIDALYEWYDRDGSVGGASEVFERHRATDPKSPPREHLWFRPKGLRWDCCEVCGIVRRMDGEPNQPCRGPVSVGPRADPQSQDKP